MMRRGAGLFLLGVTWEILTSPLAQADYFIQLTNGRGLVAFQYREEGELVKCYIMGGEIGIPLTDIILIRKAAEEEKQRYGIPVYEYQPASTSGPTIARNTSPEQKTADNSPEKYQQKLREVKQEFTSVWDDHIQAIRSGADPETVEKLRQRLLRADLERANLMEEIQERNGGTVPSWAQESPKDP